MSHQPAGENKFTSGNAIIELDPWSVDRSVPVSPSVQDDARVTPEDVGFLCDQLESVGADGQAARLEIERRHMVENDHHVLRFTAKELTSIALSLAVAHTVAGYHLQHGERERIEKFGNFVLRENGDQLDGDYLDVSLTELAPYPRDEEFDPFDVCAGRQQLYFLDGNGEIITPDEADRIPYFDAEKANEPTFEPGVDDDFDPSDVL